MASSLKEIYTAYIGSINQGRSSQSLETFCHDSVIYNGETLTRRKYEQLIEHAFDAAPDISFTVEHLLEQPAGQANSGMIASRILFECKPIKPLLDVQPRADGKTVKFSENVFYRFQEGRIAEVWSVVDQAALKQQSES